MARLGDFPVLLTSCSELSLLHVLSPQFLYLAFVTRRQAGSVNHEWTRMNTNGFAAVKTLNR